MAGVWAPFKELSTVVSQAVHNRQPEAHYALEALLLKHKPDFVSLLQNPAKNAAHRSQVKKAVKDGLDVSFLSSRLPLQQSVVDEALLLSDILDLNELSALELLLAGEQQQPRFPSLPRGLVAVLLYHDGRRSMAAALRCLVQAREGVAWTMGLSPATSALASSFTQQLLSDGLVDKVLVLLDSISVEGELQRLGKGRAVGGPDHRKQLSELIQEQRACLADTLFLWACQSPLPKPHTLTLLRHIKKKTLDSGAPPTKPPKAAGKGAPPASARDSRAASVSFTSAATPTPAAPDLPPLDSTSLSLFLTLLACLSVGEQSPGQGGFGGAGEEEEEEEGGAYPLAGDPTFIAAVHAEVLDEAGWASPTLLAAVKFAWGVVLRECAGRESLASLPELEDDSGLVEAAIAAGAFQWLRLRVITSPHFHQEECYVRQVHRLLTSFIVNMPLQVKELRNRGDEIAQEIEVRGEDNLPPSCRRDFEDFMRTIGDLYSSDPNSLALSLEFWSPVGAGGPSHKATQRQISLFKFVQLCSSLLPAPLFSPFMHMLNGLSNSAAAAHSCFSLLKANSPSLGGGGASAAISLDHFFHSLRQYYLGLRQELGSKASSAGYGISPRELGGLMAVMALVHTIADLDEGARTVMYENQVWLPVASLFGLIGCPVPHCLKAQILLTLAAFSKSPEIASSMWHTLEISQILNTVPPRAGSAAASTFVQHMGPEGSIQVELEEVESRAEEYPLTRAFLTLLNALTDVPVPATLGSGHRVTGFGPYLEFVRDLVFLRFDTRAYKRPEEKWEVASSALEVLYKLLSSHELSPDHFSEQPFSLADGTVAMAPQPPGHSLLVHMMNDSRLLRKVLSVMDEACRLLTSPSTPPPSSPSHDPLAHTALLCLKMIECSLSREEELLTALRQQSQQALVAPMAELLLSINPRTGRPDYLVTVARYVSVTDRSPELALTAVKVLRWVSMATKAARDMATSITANRDARAEILHGFVEQLEWEDADAPSGPAPSNEDEALTTVGGVHRAVQLNILQLLSGCVGRAGPTIAHFLLGFEVEGRPKQLPADITLQDPGVLGSPFTCLHAMLSLVSPKHLPHTHHSSLNCHGNNPKLAELCYKLIYQLCVDRELGTPTLRYLRNNHDFFVTQLLRLPLSPAIARGGVVGVPEVEGSGGASSSARASLLHQQAWLLRSVAVELRMTGLARQRSHTQRITSLLLGDPTNQSADPAHLANGIGDGSAAQTSFYKSDFDLAQEGHRRVLGLLDHVEFCEPTLPALELLYFDQSAVEGVIADCETEDPTSGLHYCDVKRLHAVLLHELGSLQGAAAAGQRAGVLEEIHTVLDVVVERNRVAENGHAHYQLFEGWRHLVEVLLHNLGAGGGAGLGREVRVGVLFEIVQDLLLKVEDSGPSQLTAAVHGVLLILLSHLRHTTLDDPEEPSDSLPSSLYSGPLHATMQGLVRSLMSVPSGMQRLRAYIYGGLLHYLMLTTPRGKEAGPTGPSLWNPSSEHSSVVSGNLAVLTNFGEPLMEAVCRDACSGHDVARMLALSLLDVVVTLDWHQEWLRFLVARGYLNTLAASIQWEDEALQKVLHPAPEALRVLYIYESKMALLTRLAHLPAGARQLVSLSILNLLSECRFIDMRPTHHSGSDLVGQNRRHGDEFVPSVWVRYRQLLFPLLKLLLALLTTAGPQQRQAQAQVVSLIGAHSDVFVTVLKEEQRPVSMATLQELALVTAVVSHAGYGQDWVNRGSPAAGIARVQRSMLSLLSHYCSLQHWRSAVRSVEGEGEGEGRAVDPLVAEEAFLLTQQICANVVAYCRVAMTVGGTELSSPYPHILLSPDLTEAALTPSHPHTAFSSSVTPSQTPSLGLLVRHLVDCSEAHSSALESFQQSSRKLGSGPLSTDELKTLLFDPVAMEKLSPSQQQSAARARLRRMTELKKQQLQQYTYILESMLYLLWRHLEYYLVHCRPLQPSQGMGVAGVTPGGMRHITDPTSWLSSRPTTTGTAVSADGVREEELEQLRTEVGRCLSDQLFKRLLHVEESQRDAVPEAAKGVEFVHALVRRLRRLIRLKTPVSAAGQL